MGKNKNTTTTQQQPTTTKKCKKDFSLSHSSLSLLAATPSLVILRKITKKPEKNLKFNRENFKDFKPKLNSSKT